MSDDRNDREWTELRSDVGDEVVDGLALSAAAAPPPLLKDRVLSRIASDPDASAGRAPLPPGGRRKLPGADA